ncbi:MAG: arginine--tRNA ligase [Bacteroidales bacterium]|nr:arginine--tRNA ligase [Bacteroidales bacterium]
MTINQIIENNIVKGLNELFGAEATGNQVALQKTKKEFEGDFTFVVFPWLRVSKKSPQITAQLLGDYLVQHTPEISSYNVIQGFLNLVVDNTYFTQFLCHNCQNIEFGFPEQTAPKNIVIEYSSPNTNKPLHLGHIRNNLLGWSVAEILKANHHHVTKVNLVNDRGIHICKSMLAWKKWGNGETPESAGMKGDHLIGKYYVMFDQAYKKELEQLQQSGMTNEEAIAHSSLMNEAHRMLQMWEEGDVETRHLWEKLNSWTYQGFSATYQRLGIDFDDTLYESKTYLLGKQLVETGLEKSVFYRKEDGSVWADLTADGLDEKLLLRSDGTSVYMTQDLGTAVMRHDKYHADMMIYVVGNEQEYHFDVLKLVLKKLGYEWANSIYHLSYGMVELPCGKMKSREGTVVDADDLMEEMYETAYKMGCSLSKLDTMKADEATCLCNMVGLAALKYFILKVDPKKKMLFVPEESVDFNGNTGPFIQYTHARIQSLLRKAENQKIEIKKVEHCAMLDKERDILKLLHQCPEVVQQAAENMSPAVIANYLYDVAKEFNQFYQDIPILRETDVEKISFRLQISLFTACVLKKGMALLGIQVPDRM